MSSNIFKKRIYAGHIINKFGDKQETESIYIDVETKTKENMINYKTGKKETGLTLSISGDIKVGRSHRSGGQINSTLREDFDKMVFDGVFDKKSFERFLDIWDEHHLNDLTAGSINQEDALKEFYAKSDIERSYENSKKILFDKKLNPDTALEVESQSVNAYSYGSAWLYAPLPKNVISELKTMLKIEKEQKTVPAQKQP